MKNLLVSLISLLFVIMFSCVYAQRDSLQINDSDAKAILKEALSGKTIHNVVDGKTLLIKSKENAIMLAETILFSIYGKQQIISEKPYHYGFTGNHWIISGSLPDGYDGGVFLIIIDATNGKVVRITHGK